MELLTMLRKPVSCEYICEYSCFQLKLFRLSQVQNTSLVLLYFLTFLFLLQQLLKFASHTTKEVFTLCQSLHFLLNLYSLFSTRLPEKVRWPFRLIRKDNHLKAVFSSVQGFSISNVTDCCCLFSIMKSTDILSGADTSA